MRWSCDRLNKQFTLKRPDRYTKRIRFWILAALVVLAGSNDMLAQKLPPKSKIKAPARSQIVDDSTKNVYGPSTSRWTTEGKLFVNNNKYSPIDTSVNNYHRWTYVQRFNNFYKDLGNVGTALSPIFPTFSGSIGFTSGFTCYEPYYQTEEPHLFDTKSPYTRIYVVWGGNGRAMTRIEFSRNINPRWNFGFDYRPILADKQIQYQKNVRQTISHYYDFYTTYRSKDNRYRLLFDYRRIRHRVYENGGVASKTTDTYADFFNKDAAVNLSKAVTEEKRANIHLFQQLQLAKPAQVYLTTDYFLQINKFSDNTTAEPSSFFDYKRGDSTNAKDQAQLTVFQNEAGFKGNAGPLFYNFYYKNRGYQYENYYAARSNSNLLAFKKTGTERYVGGRVGLTFDSVTEFTGGAEYLLEGYYKLEAAWKSPWIDATGRSSLSKPGMMQQVYYGSHDAWSNPFNSISALQLTGFLKGQAGPLFVSPGMTFSSVSNYVFFQEKIDPSGINYQRVLPKQSTGTQTVLSPEVRFTLKFLRHVYLRPQAIYTYFLKNDDDAFHIPRYFINTQLAYENLLFNKALQIQAGIDLHWKSAYNALAYDPVIQQFYVQDQTPNGKAFVSPAFLLADIFVNGKIKRGRFFLKYHNMVQTFTGIGYVPTPTYQGQHTVMDFGFELLLFD